jgi:micrococcal nuclease
MIFPFFCKRCQLKPMVSLHRIQKRKIGSAARERRVFIAETMRYCLVLVLLMGLPFSCSNTGEEKEWVKGRVVSIADGDTFTMLVNEREPVKVRLHGVDCPEQAQDYGQKAKQALSDLLFGGTARVERKSVDRYGRVVGIAYTASGVCVNEELLRSGLAWHYTAYDKNREWARLQEEARRAGRGLWAGPSPVAPWDWRRR